MIKQISGRVIVYTLVGDMFAVEGHFCALGKVVELRAS
jgi:hypothetical protein